MTNEEIIKQFGDRGVYSSDYNGKPCLIVEGWLTSYAILDESHAVYDVEDKKWISIVQSNTGSHRVDNKLSLVLALLNDVKLLAQIPTLDKQKSELKYQMEDDKFWWQNESQGIE